MLNAIPTHPEANSYLTLAEAEDLMLNRTAMIAEWGALSNNQKEKALIISTRQIDTLRFFHELIYRVPQDYRGKQALKFPRTNARTFSGKVDSNSTNYFIDADLANRQDLPDDFFNKGAVVIYSGTGKGKTYGVTDFDMATGKVTIDGTFSPAIDSTSWYKLIEAVPVEVKYACLEQALYIANGGGERAKMQAEGVESYSIGDLSESFGGSNTLGGFNLPISPEARGYLSRLITIIGG